MTADSAVHPLPRLPMSKALRALLTEVTGKPWELETIPHVIDPDDTNPDEAKRRRIPVKAPYGILYPLWRTYSGPPFAGGTADVSWVYQATMHGRRGDQMDWFDDAVTRCILGRRADHSFLHEITVPGMSVMDREMSDENGSNGTPDTQADLLTRDLRFILHVTPYASPEETP